MEYLQYPTEEDYYEDDEEVLNLVINGIPSIQNLVNSGSLINPEVLNLVINGIPSIPTYR